MRTARVLLGLMLTVFLWHCQQSAPLDSAEEPAGHSPEQLAHELLVLDTHIDVPYRLSERDANISERTEEGDFDYPRAREGGLDAAFMSIYIPARHQQGGAREVADGLIDMVESFASRWPEKFAPAASVEDIRENFTKGLFSLPLGMENGAPLEGSLDNLNHFYGRGIRYITLTHSRVNHLSDSSYDPERKWGGLSPFGKQVVAEMNRLGIMIDVSHISDEAFFQVIELSAAPVIASHSACRAFTPGWERNMSDEMLLRLKENGGVMQVSFGSAFVNDAFRMAREKRSGHIREHIARQGLEAPAAQEFTRQYEERNPLPYADISDVADCIGHVAELVGIAHVGLGSDFDGVGDSLPTDLKDVSHYPNLFRTLLARGLSEEDLAKVASENLLRVWSEVERIAERSK